MFDLVTALLFCILCCPWGFLLKRGGRAHRDERVSTEESVMNFAYSCEMDSDPFTGSISSSAYRYCHETLHSIFSMALFLNPSSRATVHMLANDVCTSCMKDELASASWGNLGNFTNLKIHFYDVDAEIREAKRGFARHHPSEAKTFFTNFKVGAAVKIFFPYLDVFKSIDQLVLLDADTVLCDDVSELWRLFGNFSADNQFGMAGEQDQYYEKGWYTNGCGNWIHTKNSVECPPYYKPYGLNSGVSMLRLDRLRAASFNNTVADIVAKFSKRLKLADQDVWNVYAQAAPQNAFLMPCEWNVRTDSLCRQRSMVKLLHGSRWSFHHEARSIGQAWIKVGEGKYLQNSSSPKWIQLRDAVQKTCRPKKVLGEPWP